jgi:uncharacterized protein YciI
MLRRSLLILTACATLISAGPTFAQDVAAPTARGADAFFLYRLIPPRPTFTEDMTPAERAVMMQHVAYWTAEAKAGRVVVFGPVVDPKAPWGMALLRVADRAEAERIAAADPAQAPAMNMTHELLPMPRAILGARP